jgi:hypothetical protein
MSVKKFLLGGLVAAGLVLIPASSGLGTSSLALGCPGALGAGCTAVDLVYGALCSGVSPVDVGTIGPLTLETDSTPSVDCPV